MSCRRMTARSLVTLGVKASLLIPTAGNQLLRSRDSPPDRQPLAVVRTDDGYQLAISDRTACCYAWIERNRGKGLLQAISLAVEEKRGAAIHRRAVRKTPRVNNTTKTQIPINGIHCENRTAKS